MHLAPKVPASFGALGSFLAALALTSSINSAFALPANSDVELAKREDFDPPGLGVELEITKISYKSDPKEWEKATKEERAILKGAKISPKDFGQDRPQDDWKITAELGGSGLPFTEIITDGTKYEIGKHGVGPLGKQIATYMGDWAPCRQNQYPPKFADIKGMAPQVTAAMPLEGVLQVLKDGKDKKYNALGNKDANYNDHIVIANKDSFKTFGKIKPGDISDEFLGFFSLLTSYCVLANENIDALGPKHSLNVMPRTDFLGMYKKFIEEKLRQEISTCGNSLYTIVSAVSNVAHDELKDYEFKWKPDNLVKDIGIDWDGKADNIKKGRLSVKQFLDTLQMNDKVAKKQLDLVKLMDLSTRNGQIGGLNGRFESVVGSRTSPAPIFEFSDLKVMNGTEVATRFAEYEDKAIQLHKLKEVGSVSNALFNVIEISHGGTAGERKPKMVICPQGQVPIGGSDQCTSVGPISKE